jgi:hypothetical protein
MTLNIVSSFFRAVMTLMCLKLLLLPSLILFLVYFQLIVLFGPTHARKAPYRAQLHYKFLYL